jgi:hypothetical protein
MKKGQYQLFLGLAFIIVICVSLVISYYIVIKPHTLFNQTTTTIPTTTTTTLQNIYYRPFNLIYANENHDKTINESNDVIIFELQNFPKRPTIITDVLLNTDPDLYSDFINRLKQITPNLCFALGFKDQYDLSDLTIYNNMISLATKYARYTSCIRIDHFDSFVEVSGDAAVNKLLTDLHNLGFQHIISNPWKKPNGGNWQYLDAAQIAVDHRLSPPTWLARSDKIQEIIQNSPSGFIVLVNYENPTGQETLASLGADESIDAMSIAANQQNSSSIPYKWMPPWSKNYDPYQLNTLNWIANKLAEVDS